MEKVKVRFHKARVIERAPGVFVGQYQKHEGMEKGWETIEKEFDDHVLAVFELMAGGHMTDEEFDLIAEFVETFCVE